MTSGRLSLTASVEVITGKSLHPYTAVTDKQREAMKEANVDYVNQSVYEITHTCLCRLLVV